MRALEYRKSIPRYALQRVLGKRALGLDPWRLAPLRLCDRPEPPLPAPGWVRVRPRLAGVCGSDLATIAATGSPYLAPVTSMPFVLGHETVGLVVETGSGVTRVREGDRVVLHPALGCRVRGIEPPCAACAEGRDALCRNVTRGVIGPGIQTGYCRDTGGAFGDSFVAHESQLYRVSEDVPDEAAVLIEPLACALHGVLRAPPAASDTVLLLGCGAMGLLTVAALRATGCTARIVAVAKHDHQRERAARLGADELLDSRGAVVERYRRWARVLGAEVLAAELGKPAVLGGADVTFDCVASSTTLDDAIRFTRSGGTLVLVGMPAIPRNVDWTPLWYKELTLRAAYAYGPERCPDGQRETFDIALELMRAWSGRLAPLVSAPFELSEYRAALASAFHAGSGKAVKTIFRIH